MQELVADGDPEIGGRRAIKGALHEVVERPWNDPHGAGLVAGQGHAGLLLDHGELALDLALELRGRDLHVADRGDVRGKGGSTNHVADTPNSEGGDQDHE